MLYRLPDANTEPKSSCIIAQETVVIYYKKKKELLNKTGVFGFMDFRP